METRDHINLRIIHKMQMYTEPSESSLAIHILGMNIFWYFLKLEYFM